MWAAPSSASAPHDPVAEDELAQLAAHERDAAAVQPVKPAGDLVEVARRHAQRLAASGHLQHNANLGREVSGWEVLGENVGRGPAVGDIHSAFMASATHRANILDRRFTDFGVGVAVADGELWVVQVFRQPLAPPVAQAEPAPAAPVATPVATREVSPPTTAAPVTTLPAPRRPPVAGLPAGPAAPVEVASVAVGHASPLRAVPPIPLSVKLAATFLVAVVAAQALVVPRVLRLVPA